MITNKFIHVHIPRTAGQFIRARIKERQPLWKFLINFSHLTLKESNEKLAEVDKELVNKVPSFCVVRNPWDWYVSRFFFRQKEWRREEQAPFTDIENFSNDKKGFQEHMRMLEHMIANDEKPKKIHKRGIPRIWHRPTISIFYDDLTAPSVDYLIRFENLESELVAALSQIDPRAFEPRRLASQMKRKFNNSIHKHYRHYYDDYLRDMVQEWDKEYIERFGYEF